jgi:hypothetical protein
MSERKVISVQSGDRATSIDPATMTHSVVIAEATKTDMKSGNPADIVDEVQAALNPTFWGTVQQQCKQGRIFARSHMAVISRPVTAEAIYPVLKELGVPENTSIFVRGATMSLDGGNSAQQIYALVAFADRDPRLIISVKEPVATAVQQEQPSTAKKSWWKLW